MTRAEIAKLIYVIRGSYIQAFSKTTANDIEVMIAAWQAMLEDYTFDEASIGLKVYLASDTKGFPPSVGQVIDCIHKSVRASDNELSSLEAWAMVRKALSNSIYNAETEFAKLPAIVQKAVGSPANLREMSQLDIEKVETVEQSHFIRSFEAMTKRAKEEAKIPTKVLELINKTAARLTDSDKLQIESRSGI